MSLVQQILTLLVPSLLQLQAVNYSATAALTIAVYDTILNMPREIEFVWPTVWSLPKFLYLFARYYTILCFTPLIVLNSIPRLSVTGCQTYYWILVIGTWIFNPIVNTTLLLRLYALYGRNKRLLAIVIFVYLVEEALILFSAIRSGLSVTAKVFTLPPELAAPGCLSLTQQGQFDFGLNLVAWLANIVFSIFLFLLTAYKFYQQTSSFTWRDFGQIVSPVLLTMFADGTIFFIIIAIAVVVTGIISVTVKNALNTVAYPYLSLAYSLSGTRLILNLREAAAKDRSRVGNSWDATLTYTTIFRGPRRFSDEEDDRLG